MTKSIAYQEKLPEIMAIPKDKTKVPTMPMDTYVQEAKYLYHWGMDDIELLMKAGLRRELVEDLRFRADAASEAQSLWHNVLDAMEEARRRWRIESPEAYELRDELLHYMRYAFRDEEALLAKVASIAEGDSDADMIQDLNDAASLGKQHAALLEAVGFDFNKLDRAAQMSAQMGDLKGKAAANRESDNSEYYRKSRQTAARKAAANE